MLWPQYRNELSLHFTLEFEFKRLTPKANFSHMLTDQENIFTAKVYYFPTGVLNFTFAEEEDTFLSRSWSFLQASPKFINFGSSSEPRHSRLHTSMTSLVWVLQICMKMVGNKRQSLTIILTIASQMLTWARLEAHS